MVMKINIQWKIIQLYSDYDDSSAVEMCNALPFSCLYVNNFLIRTLASYWLLIWWCYCLLRWGFAQCEIKTREICASVFSKQQQQRNKNSKTLLAVRNSIITTTKKLSPCHCSPFFLLWDLPVKDFNNRSINWQQNKRNEAILFSNITIQSIRQILENKSLGGTGGKSWKYFLPY